MMPNEKHTSWLRTIIRDSKIHCLQSPGNQNTLLGMLQSSYEMLDAVSPLLLNYSDLAANQKTLNRDLRSWQTENIIALYGQILTGMSEILPFDLIDQFTIHIAAYKCFGCTRETVEDQNSRFNALFALGVTDSTMGSSHPICAPYLLVHYDHTINKIWQTHLTGLEIKQEEIMSASLSKTFVLNSEDSIYYRLKQRD